jgi:hypothetical protein
MTPGWHIIRDLNLLSLTMNLRENSNVSSNKCLCKIIIAIKTSQLQITTKIPYANSIVERVYKFPVVNYILKSFDLENNHENQEEQEDNQFDCFIQLTAWLQDIRSTYHKTLQATPCQLFPVSDMTHNIAFRVNWD